MGVKSTEKIAVVDFDSTFNHQMCLIVPFISSFFVHSKCWLKYTTVAD